MRRTLATALLVTSALGLLACEPNLSPPPGAGPLRYRDAIFTSVTTTSDVLFGKVPTQSGGNADLKLDLYRPTGDTVTGRPAIVWVHGGSFRNGDKRSPEIVDEATTFARKGFVSVSINYRQSERGCFTPDAACLRSIVDAKHDAQAAVRFLRARAATYGIDPTRIAMAGTSAGAITALNVGYGSDDVGTSGTPGPDSRVRATVSLSGGHLLTTPERGEPPALLFHGDADPIVPYSWATRTRDAANGAGADAVLVTFPKAGHVPYTQHRATILTTTTNFFYWALDLTHAAR